MNIDISKFRITDPKGVLVKCEHNTSLVSDSGIYLGRASIVEDRPTSGIVIQVGRDVMASGDIKVGDTAFWAITSGIDFYKDETDNTAYIILDDDRILGVLEKD